MIIKQINLYIFCIILIIIAYLFTPSYCDVFLLAAILAISYKYPAIGIMVFFISPLFDRWLLIPYTNRSIAYLIFMTILVKLIKNKNISKIKKNLLLYFIIFLFVAGFSVYLGFRSVVEKEGYADPGRGIIFVMGLTVFIIYFLSNKIDVVQFIRRISYLFAIMFILSGFIGLVTGEGFANQYRFSGTMVDPNYYSKFGLLALILLFDKNTEIKKIFKNILIALVLILTIFTYSKTAIIILLIIMSYLLLFELKRNKYIIYIFMVFIIIVLLLSKSFFFDVVAKRFDITSGIIIFDKKLTNPIDILTTGRTFIWRSAINVFISEPKKIFFGYGIGMGKEIVNIATGVPIVLHNGFLELLIESGIIGLVSFLLLMYHSFRYIRIELKLERSMIFPLLMILFISYNMTLSGFWSKQNLVIISIMNIYYGEKTIRTYKA